jgi:hypothetical protein
MRRRAPLPLLLLLLPHRATVCGLRAAGRPRLAAAPPRAPPPRLSISFEQVLKVAEEEEAEIAKSMADNVAVFRQGVQDLLPRDETFEFLQPGWDAQLADAVAELREILRLVLFQERFAGSVVLAAAVLLCVAGGVVVGDRTRPCSRPWYDDENTFRTGMSEAATAAFDKGSDGGGSSLVASAAERAAAWTNEASRSKLLPPEQPGRRAVSAGLWVELLACVGLDAAGEASLFYPVGELADAGWAFFSALVVELFFDWPQLALVALWEELLPFTDALPTATIGWFLVTVLGLRPDRRDRPNLFRGPVDPSLFTAGVRPPVADRKSYAPPEEHLREGSRPWEE